MIPGPNTISFDIPGSGPRTISLQSPLPAITTPVTTDGTTQPGYSGSPLIDLNGAAAGSANGLVIETSNSAVVGLAINDFGGTGIVLYGAGTDGNVIEGNFIGTDPTGTQA